MEVAVGAIWDSPGSVSRHERVPVHRSRASRLAQSRQRPRSSQRNVVNTSGREPASARTSKKLWSFRTRAGGRAGETHFRSSFRTSSGRAQICHPLGTTPSIDPLAINARLGGVSVRRIGKSITRLEKYQDSAEEGGAGRIGDTSLPSISLRRGIQMEVVLSRPRKSRAFRDQYPPCLRQWGRRNRTRLGPQRGETCENTK